MRVRTEGRTAKGIPIEVMLEESDGKELIKGWDGMDLLTRWKALSDRADLMVVEYMHRRNEISDEYFKQRAREIKEGHVKQ